MILQIIALITVLVALAISIHGCIKTKKLALEIEELCQKAKENAQRSEAIFKQLENL